MPSERTLLSIIESPSHPNFSAVYRREGFAEVKALSMRKAIAQLKKKAPDCVVAEFFYGYGNNYAGVNVSNLDVFLYSLQKYAPRARVIVLVSKSDARFVDKLAALFPLHGVLELPTREALLADLLRTV